MVSLRVALIALIPLRACLGAADTQPQKSCEELQKTAFTDEIAAANDGRYSKSNTGAVLRAAIVNVRALKKIAARCAAEGKADVAEQARLSIAGAVNANFALFLEFLGYRQALSDLEEKRFDKQVGASTSGGAGTTSLTTKGSVPSLLGFAVENGAMTRSVSGTTITFRAVPWDVVKALADHDYLASGPTPQPGTLAGVLSQVSAAVSVDASRGNTAGSGAGSTSSSVVPGDKQQVSGYTFHYQILDRRDPRDIHYARLWNTLSARKGLDLANRLNQLAALMRAGVDAVGKPVTAPWVPDFEAWRKDTANKLEAASIDDVEKVISAQAVTFKKIVATYPELQAQAKVAAEALSEYFLDRNTGIKKITKAPTLAFDYSVTRQANTNGTVPVAAGATVPASLPDLSNFKLIFAKGFQQGPELTANASFTIFNSLPPGSTAGRLRDGQASLQLDVPLAEIAKTSNMVLSFSGQFVRLLEQPLGAAVIVNTKSVTAKGNMGLVQAKLTVPVKGSGVQIPISVTWSNRTELILERDVRANFGVTFDLDKLFAKP
jgi:hypothetical protein